MVPYSQYTQYICPHSIIHLEYTPNDIGNYLGLGIWLCRLRSDAVLRQLDRMRLLQPGAELDSTSRARQVPQAAVEEANIAMLLPRFVAGTGMRSTCTRNHILDSQFVNSESQLIARHSKQKDTTDNVKEVGWVARKLLTSTAQQANCQLHSSPHCSCAPGKRLCRRRLDTCPPGHLKGI